MHERIRLQQLQNRLDAVSQSFDSVNLSTRLQQLQNRLDAVSLLEIRQFNSPHDIYQYWTQRLHSAKKSVDDLTWGHYPPHYTSDDKKALKTYVDYIPEVCSRGSYREVMTFPNIERVTRAKQMLRQNIHNYHLRYYDLGDHIGTPPLIQFSVVDSEEVFIFFYREPSSVGTDELRLAARSRCRNAASSGLAAPIPALSSERTQSIRHPTIVKLFVDYFDSIWRAATPLKQGDVVSKELLEKIEAESRLRQSPLRSVVCPPSLGLGDAKEPGRVAAAVPLPVRTSARAPLLHAFTRARIGDFVRVALRREHRPNLRGKPRPADRGHFAPPDGIEGLR